MNLREAGPTTGGPSGREKVIGVGLRNAEEVAAPTKAALVTRTLGSMSVRVEFCPAVACPRTSVATSCLRATSLHQDAFCHVAQGSLGTDWVLTAMQHDFEPLATILDARIVIVQHCILLHLLHHLCYCLLLARSNWSTVCSSLHARSLRQAIRLPYSRIGHVTRVRTWLTASQAG